MNLYIIIILFLHFCIFLIGIVYALRDFLTIKKTRDSALPQDKLPRLLSRGVAFLLLSFLTLVLVSFSYL
ncbi:MAG: hypothetical protein BAJALOKI2v1_120044 [Promethearchaeota archaeon]|nr:MAG: hypothetical protein BAJALOKI2v1_120044 [Candidatus Lokiarchaeota archaeon]